LPNNIICCLEQFGTYAWNWAEKKLFDNKKLNQTVLLLGTVRRIHIVCMTLL